MRLVRMPEYGLARQAGLRAEKLSAGRRLFSSIWAALLRGALYIMGCGLSVQGAVPSAKKSAPHLGA